MLTIIPSIAGTSLSATWLRKHIATPTVRSNWTLTALYLIPIFICFAGIAYHAFALSDAAAPYLICSTVGAVMAILISPALKRKQNRRDQSRLDATLED